jgi:hypothetical protein
MCCTPAGGRGSSAGVAAGVGGAPAATPGAQSSDLGTALEAGTGTLAGLLQGARPQQPQIVATPPPMPAFAAHATLPADYVAPYSGGGPQPVQQDQQLPAFSDLSLGAGPQGSSSAEPAAQAAMGAIRVASGGSSGSSTATRWPGADDRCGTCRTDVGRRAPGGKDYPAKAGSTAGGADLGQDRPAVSGQIQERVDERARTGPKGISIYLNGQRRARSI